MSNALHTTNHMDPEYTGTPYTRSELKAAADAVCNSVNWKLPIRSIVAEGQQAITAEAVVFFTGSVPTFKAIPTMPGFVEVKAAGYYQAVGA